MRQDIYGGLKNAIERGATQEQAIKSFVSAGYKESDVRDAARALEQGVLTMMQPVTTPNNALKKLPAIPAKPQAKPQNTNYVSPQTNFKVEQPHKKPDWIVIVLVVVLLFSVIAFVSSLLFRKEIAQFLSAFLG